MMTLEALQTVLLEGLTPEEHRRVVELFTRRDYPAGTKILGQGEACETLSVIASGTLLVETREQGKIGHIGPGECLGEVSLLTEQPASATVSAVTDATLWDAPHTTVRALMHETPRLAANLGRLLAQRLAARTARRRESEVILLVSAAASAGGLGVNLAASLAHHSGEKVVLLDLGRPIPGDSGPTTRLAPSAPIFSAPLPSVTVARARGLASERVQALVKELAGEYRFVLIWAPGEGHGPSGTATSPRTAVRPLLALASRGVGILAYEERRWAAEIAAALGGVSTEWAILGAPEPHTPAAAEEIEDEIRSLVGSLGGSEGPAGGPAKKTVVALLPALPEEFSHKSAAPDWVLVHDEQPFSQAVGRLARRIAGKRVGIALGAGAGRGFAHIWVLRALDRLGVRADVLAGTSVGAIVGGLHATGVSYAEIETLMLAFGRRRLRWSLPIHSLIAGSALDRAILKIATTVGGASSATGPRMEEFSLPCAFVATDFATGEEVVLRRGIGWQCARASVSIPGVFPPTRLQGRLLIDGGVVNPVPCRVARELGADIVLGVSLEVMPTPDGRGTAEPRTKVRERLPTWPQVLLRSCDLIQRGLTRQCIQEADVPIRVFTPPMELMNFRGGPHFVEAGERAVERATDALRAALPWLRQK